MSERLRKLGLLVGLLSAGIAYHLVLHGFDGLWVLGSLWGVAAVVILSWPALLVADRLRSSSVGRNKEG